MSAMCRLLDDLLMVTNLPQPEDNIRDAKKFSALRRQMIDVLTRCKESLGGNNEVQIHQQRTHSQRANSVCHRSSHCYDSASLSIDKESPKVSGPSRLRRRLRRINSSATRSGYSSETFSHISSVSSAYQSCSSNLLESPGLLPDLHTSSEESFLKMYSIKPCKVVLERLNPTTICFYTSLNNNKDRTAKRKRRRKRRGEDTSVEYKEKNFSDTSSSETEKTPKRRKRRGRGQRSIGYKQKNYIKRSFTGISRSASARREYQLTSVEEEETFYSSHHQCRYVEEEGPFFGFMSSDIEPKRTSTLEESLSLIDHMIEVEPAWKNLDANEKDGIGADIKKLTAFFPNLSSLRDNTANSLETYCLEKLGYWYNRYMLTKQEEIPEYIEEGCLALRTKPPSVYSVAQDILKWDEMNSGP